MLHSYCIDRNGNGLESETFFLMLGADLNRYICEVTPPGAKLKEIKDNAKNYYERAERKAERLHHCSPVKMSRDLHHANFIHEFLNDTSFALKVCEASVLKAQASLHTVDEDTYVEANHIMELLKENCAIWKGQDPTQINNPDFND